MTKKDPALGVVSEGELHFLKSMHEEQRATKLHPILGVIASIRNKAKAKEIRKEYEREAKVTGDTHRAHLDWMYDEVILDLNKVSDDEAFRFLSDKKPTLFHQIVHAPNVSRGLVFWLMGRENLNRSTALVLLVDYFEYYEHFLDEEREVFHQMVKRLSTNSYAGGRLRIHCGHALAFEKKILSFQALPKKHKFAVLTSEDFDTLEGNSGVHVESLGPTLSAGHVIVKSSFEEWYASRREKYAIN